MMPNDLFGDIVSTAHCSETIGKLLNHVIWIPTQPSLPRTSMVIPNVNKCQLTLINKMITKTFIWIFNIKVVFNYLKQHIPSPSLRWGFTHHSKQKLSVRFRYEMSPTVSSVSTLGPQLVALFEKGMEPLGGGALLEGVDLQEVS